MDRTLTNRKVDTHGREAKRSLPWHTTFRFLGSTPKTVSTSDYGAQSRKRFVSSLKRAFRFQWKLTAGSLRLLQEFDFASFNEGNYEKAVEEQKAAENVSSVLYPNDNHMVGKILRLKQQFFFVSATLSGTDHFMMPDDWQWFRCLTCLGTTDILRRFKKTGRPWTDFPNQVSIQLNGMR